MKGTALSLLVAVGILTACAGGPGRDDAAGGPPVQQATGSGTPVPSATDGGTPVQPGPPSTDAGSAAWVQPPRGDGSLSVDPATLPAPPAPAPDDPAACAPQALPFPDLGARPDRPCTEEGRGGTTTYEYDAAGRIVHRSVHSDSGYEETDTYRYDATGRVVYRSVHNNSGSGHDETYTSEDDGGVRVEMLTRDGNASVDVTQFWDGKPLEADHFDIGADGGLVHGGHSTWLYDAQGREQYLIRQPGAYWPRDVERTVYDANGRPYFVDHSYSSPDVTGIAQHNFTFQSWFASGVRAYELDTCDINYGPPCDRVEQRWEPCGNLAYVASQTAWRRINSWTDWSWDAAGRPSKMHERWLDLGRRVFDSTESYQVDPAGRVVSGKILNVNPPDAIIPLPEQQLDSYGYDDAGHLIERSLDGNTVFHARFDAAGRLIELGTGSDIVRWTYDGCGR